MTTTVVGRFGAVALTLAATPAALLAAEGGAKKSVLEPDLVNSGVTLLVFLCLLGVLYKFAWGPILKGLEAREGSQRKALDDAKLARDEAAALRVQLQADAAKAQEQVKALLDEARKDAEALRAREREAGIKEAQAERDRAKREIQAATETALKEITEQAVDLATMMSTKALRRNLTADDHRRLLDESLAELATTAKASA